MKICTCNGFGYSKNGKGLLVYCAVHGRGKFSKPQLTLVEERALDTMYLEELEQTRKAR